MKKKNSGLHPARPAKTVLKRTEIMAVHWPAPDIEHPNGNAALPRTFVFQAYALTISFPIHAWKVQVQYTDAAGVAHIVQVKHRFNSWWSFPTHKSRMTCDVTFPPGIWWLDWVRAEYHAGATSKWGYAYNLQKARIEAPVVTQPGLSWTAFPTFRGTGLEGSKVLLTSNSTLVLEEATVSNGRWQITPGSPLPMSEEIKAWAFQVYNGEVSPPSVVVGFALLIPPQITDIAVSPSGLPTIRGAGGLAGFPVQVALSEGAGGVMSTTVEENGSWAATSQRAWLVGTHTIRARQRGKAPHEYSDWSQPRTFTVGPLRPGLDNPGFVKVARPPLSGSGANGARIEVRQTGSNAVVLVTTASKDRWSGTPTRDLESGDPVTLVAVQTVNSTESRSDSVSFTLLRAPRIIRVDVSAASVLTIYGEGHPGIRIEVVGQSSGTPSLATVVDWDGTWAAIAPYGWSIGKHVIIACHRGQNVYHQSDFSDPSAFQIPPPPPLIVQPSIPTPPAQELNIAGVISGNTAVILYDANTDQIIPGTFRGGATIRWFSPAQYWALGTHSVKAVQTYNGVTSADSAPCTFHVTLGKLIVLSPAEGEVIEQDGVFSGQQGYAGPGSSVVLSRFPVGDVVSSALPDTNGNWVSTPLSLKPGQHTLSVATSLGTLLSPPVKRSFKIKPAKLSITPPLASPVEPRQALTVTGDFHEGAILRMNNAEGEVAGTFTHDRLHYTFTPLQPWQAGEQRIWVTQKVAGLESGPSNALALIARPVAPVIHEPREQSLTAADAPISGVCRSGAAVSLLDPDGNVLAQATVTGKNWTASYLWPTPGTNKLQAIQVVNHVDSSPTAIRTFTIKPKTLSVIPPQGPITARHVLSITEVYPGSATLELLDADGKVIPGTFTGTGVQRLFTPSQDWSTGNNTVFAVQTVSGARSDPSAACMFSILPMTLSIVPLSGLAEPAQMLTLLGVDPAVDKLFIYQSDGVKVPGKFSGSAGIYQFTPSDYWPPGVVTTVYATQLVADAESLPSAPIQLMAKPYPPEFDLPLSGEYCDATFTMSGACALGATVQVLNSDGTLLGSWPAVGTRWSGIYTWLMPGVKHKQLRQVVNDVESDPGPVRTFTIMVEAPRVTLPAHPAEPYAPLELTGVHNDADELTVFNPNSSVRGTFHGTGTLRYFTPAAPWGPSNQVRAAQTVDGFQSDPGARVSFVAKPPCPTISCPVNGENYDATFQLSGTGRSGATVQVLDLEGDQLGSFLVSGGSWKGPCNALAPGLHYIRAKQTQNGLESELSPTCEFGVRPGQLNFIAPPQPAAPFQALTLHGVHWGTASLTLISNGAPVPGTFIGDGAIRQFIPDQMWWAESQVYASQTVDGVESALSKRCDFSVKLTPLIIDYPQPDQTLTLGDVAYGRLPVALPTAVMALLDANTSQLAAFIDVNADGTWRSGPLRLQPGFHDVIATLSVGGLTPVESDRRLFKIRSHAPDILPPVTPVGSRQSLKIVNLHSATANVNVIDGDGNPVSGSITVGGYEATFLPDKGWAVGENRIRATQIIAGVESAPSPERVFNVAAELQVPTFLLPVADSQTPSRPPIKVMGLPDALMSLRNAQDGALLHVQLADSQGVLALTLVKAFAPGAIALQVKQQSAGRESPWSTSHTFTVSAAPKEPVINRPTQNSRVSRKPQISGSATTGGEVLLRHVDDLNNLLGTVHGVNAWRWSAQQNWSLGLHGVQAQKTDAGDSSPWSPVRTFEVVAAKYEIAELGSVLAQPVVADRQSVLLRMQVVDHDTDKGKEGLEVRWTDLDRMGLWSVSLTDKDGWASYPYTPLTSGVKELEADVSGENGGVLTRASFSVTALPEDAWAKDFELFLNGHLVDLAKDDLRLRRGRLYTLTVRLREGSPLKDTAVTLEDLADAQSLGLEFSPILGEARTLEGGSLSWSISSSSGSAGLFGLNLLNSKLPDWHLPCHLESDDLSDAVAVRFDKFEGKVFGEPLYACLGTEHTLTLRPLSEEIIGQDVMLGWVQHLVEHDVILTPGAGTVRKMPLKGLTWTLDCKNSTAAALLGLELKIVAWDFTSRVLPISLADNKGIVANTFGPQEMGGAATYNRYGIQVASAYTGAILTGFPGTVIINREPFAVYTDEAGWIYVNYNKGESATIVVDSPYDRQ